LLEKLLADLSSTKDAIEQIARSIRDVEHRLTHAIEHPPEPVASGSEAREDNEPRKVAILGGGIAGLTTAWYLATGDNAGKFDVTVYQMGWRLGGKGASGRSPSGRVKEHGLHVWMGFYENAFRLMRDVYRWVETKKTAKDPDVSKLAVATFRDAFLPDHAVGVAIDGDPWKAWTAYFPPNPGLPGDAITMEDNPFSMRQYFARTLEMVKTVVLSRDFDPGAEQAASDKDPTVSRADAVVAAYEALVEAFKLHRTGLDATNLATRWREVRPALKSFALVTGESPEAVEVALEETYAAAANVVLGLKPTQRLAFANAVSSASRKQISRALEHWLEKILESIPHESRQLVLRVLDRVVARARSEPEVNRTARKRAGESLALAAKDALLRNQPVPDDWDAGIRKPADAWSETVERNRQGLSPQTSVEKIASPPPYRWPNAANEAESAPSNEDSPGPADSRNTQIIRRWSRLLRGSAIVGAGMWAGVFRLFEQMVDDIEDALSTNNNYLWLELLEAIERQAKLQMDEIAGLDPALRTRWELVELSMIILRGIVVDGVLKASDGLDCLNEYDCREWLRKHGASETALQSSVVRGLYNLAFSDTEPLAAGQAIRGALRMFFTYRGALFWKLSAGMGDVVFAPLYLALEAQGVKFEFFHRVESLTATRSTEGVDTISEVALSVQATVPGTSSMLKDGTWPDAPVPELLREIPWAFSGNEAEAVFESPYADAVEWGFRPAVLKARDPSARASRYDFDLLVLALGGGAIGPATKALSAANEHWEAMVGHIHTMPTVAMQLWLDRDLHSMGWTLPPTTMSGLRGRFDSWSDMTHVIPFEESGRADSDPQKWPQALVYFCGVAPGAKQRNATDHGGAESPEDWLARMEREGDGFLRSAAQWTLDHQAVRMWPGAATATGQFDFSRLVHVAGRKASALPTNCDAEGGAYLRLNWRPSDLYTLALPGTIRYRMSPLNVPFDNLTIAGDWTDCGFNEGCVEAAVMSGMLASHALSERPPLRDIVGYDHP
jgi:hypothetical protein